MSQKTPQPSSVSSVVAPDLVGGRVRFATDMVAAFLYNEDRDLEAVGLAVAQPLESDPTWTVVLLFSIEPGDMRLISHTVVSTRHDWRDGTVDNDPSHRWLRQLAIDLWPEVDAPARQLTTRIVRSASTGQLERMGRNLVHAMRGQARVPTDVGDPAIKRRRGRSDLELAKIAARYVALLATGERAPSKALAAELHLSRDRTRKVIESVRECGLLEGGSPGRAAGALTERARQLLELEGKS